MAAKYYQKATKCYNKKPTRTMKIFLKKEKTESVDKLGNYTESVL